MLCLYHRRGKEVNFLQIAPFGKLRQSALTGHAQAHIAEHAAELINQGTLHAADDFGHSTVKGKSCLYTDTEEIQKLRQELQETKEQNSMLSWEKSVLEQEITEKTLIYSSEMQTMQSKVAEMTDELAMQKQQKSEILKLCQSLLKENDDLRNNNGLLTREQEESNLAEIARLQYELDSNRY